MLKRFILLAGLISTLLVSCFLPTATAAVPPTQTVFPTSTPALIPLTETPTQLTLRVADEKINCRFGPGVVYASVNTLSQGQSARVIGRNESSTWWYIRDPGNPNGMCWVSAQVTQINGDAPRLAVVAPLPAHATKISLRIEPYRIFVACDQFPQTIFFESNISANGPALVRWRLESSAGYVSAEMDLIFQEAGTQTVNGYHLVPSAGDYWIKIHVLKPNEMIQQLNFPANCAP